MSSTAGSASMHAASPPRPGAGAAPRGGRPPPQRRVRPRADAAATRPAPAGHARARAPSPARPAPGPRPRGPPRVRRAARRANRRRGWDGASPRAVAFRDGTFDLGVGLLDGRGRAPARRRRALASADAASSCTRERPSASLLLGEPGVELLQAGDGLRRVDLRDVKRLALLGERERAARSRSRPRQALLRGVPLGDEFELAAPGARAAAQHVLGEHVAVAGDDGEVAQSARPASRARGVEVVDDDDPREQPADAVGRGDEVGGRLGPAGKSRHAGAAAGIRHHDLDPTGRRDARVLERGDRGVPVSASTASASEPSAAAIAAS